MMPLFSHLQRAFKRVVMLHRLNRALAQRQAHGLPLIGLDLCNLATVSDRHMPDRRSLRAPQSLTPLPRFCIDPPINWRLIGISIERATLSTGFKSNLNKG